MVRKLTVAKYQYPRSGEVDLHKRRDFCGAPLDRCFEKPLGGREQLCQHHRTVSPGARTVSSDEVSGDVFLTR